MRTIFLLLLLLTSVRLLASDNDEARIRAMLAHQVIEWNNGNIEGYMKGYWEHDSLTFIGRNGPTYGYAQTLERYRRAYPDAKAMGVLTSTIVSLSHLSPEYYFVVGKWHLKRDAGDLSGSYTLLIKKIDGIWVIINDHSS